MKTYLQIVRKKAASEWGQYILLFVLRYLVIAPVPNTKKIIAMLYNATLDLLLTPLWIIFT